jgi:predicted methyltransferase
MLEISRERLADAGADLRFLALDFRDPRWPESVGEADAVLSMQAVHELRHKRHAPALYRQIASVLRPGGIVLVCDHVPGPTPDARRSALFMTVEEQIVAFAAAGLKGHVLLESDGLALYRSVS